MMRVRPGSPSGIEAQNAHVRGDAVERCARIHGLHETRSPSLRQQVDGRNAGSFDRRPAAQFRDGKVSRTIHDDN